MQRSEGTFITATAKSIFAHSPQFVEALGLKEAMMLASNFSFPSVIFESDNMDLVEICRGNKIMEVIRGITTHIMSFRNGFQNCGFTWTSREGNGVAYTIAAQMAEGSLTSTWTFNPPLEIRRALIQDCQSLFA